MPVHFFLPKSKATHCHYVIKYVDLICVVCNVALKLEGQVEDTAGKSGTVPGRTVSARA